MSVFGDFQKAWAQRFPGCELPQAWEEDVRANLSKHRQRVAALNAELEKEEFYVEYLEHLLADVERVKQNPQLPSCESIPTSVSVLEKENVNATSDCAVSSDVNSTSANLQNTNAESIVPKTCKDNSNDQNSYVTVIEVGGTILPLESVNSQSEKEISSNSVGRSVRVDEDAEPELSSFQKKKPPAPPKKPRKSIPVQAVPPVKQKAVVNSEDIPKIEEKPVIDAVVESNDVNNSLVTEEKQEVIFDMVCSPENKSESYFESEHKKVEASLNDNHPEETNSYDDENIYDTVAPDEVETSSSHTVVSESSKEDGEGDYVVFSESYDSYQDCPPVVSSRSRIADCLLSTQRSIEEESPEYATYMNIDYFLQKQKSASSKAARCESVGGDSDDEDAFLARSFSDHEMEPEQVADYTEKKGSGTSAPSDDVFDMDSGKFCSMHMFKYCFK